MYSSWINPKDILNKLSFGLKSGKIYLILAVVLGIVVRLYGLDMQGLWFDELYAVGVGLYKNFILCLKEWISFDLQPPLHEVFLYFWIKLFGNSEISVKLPSAIAGILSIFIMYFLSKKVLGNKHIAISATILIALSSATIYYSQEVRPYSFLVMFSIVLTLLWISLSEKINNLEANKKDFFVFGLFSLLTIYTHYFGGILIALQFLYLFFIACRVGKYRTHIIILGIILGIMFIPWFMYHSWRLKQISTLIDWIDRPSIESLIALIHFIFNRYLIILLLIPLIGDSRRILKRFSDRNVDSIINSTVTKLLYLSLMSVLIVGIVGYFIPVFYPRYFILILPAVYLLISSLISLNPDFSDARGNAYVFIVCIISLILFLFVPGNNIYSTNIFYRPYKSEPFYGSYKQQWREPCKYVMDNYRNGHAILVDRDPKLFIYYFEKFAQGKVIRWFFYPSTGRTIDLRWFRLKFDRVYVFSNFMRLDPQVEERLILQSKTCEMKTYNDLYLYDCQLR